MMMMMTLPPAVSSSRHHIRFYRQGNQNELKSESAINNICLRKQIHTLCRITCNNAVTLFSIAITSTKKLVVNRPDALSLRVYLHSTYLHVRECEYGR